VDCGFGWVVGENGRVGEGWVGRLSRFSMGGLELEGKCVPTTPSYECLGSLRPWQPIRDLYCL